MHVDLFGKDNTLDVLVMFTVSQYGEHLRHQQERSPLSMVLPDGQPLHPFDWLGTIPVALTCGIRAYGNVSTTTTTWQDPALMDTCLWLSPLQRGGWRQAG